MKMSPINHKTEKPTVAIITRTKNREILLSRTIESVFNQTYKDFVLVIVNDGGNKASVDSLIEKYAKDKNKVLHLHSSTSRGRWPAANRGINESESKYVTLLDDDDTWAPKFLEKTIAFLENNPESGAITGSDKITEEVVGSKIVIKNKEPFFRYGMPPTLFEMCGYNNIHTGAFIYKRSVYKKIGLYDQLLPVLGDWDFNIRFLREFDIGVVPTSLANAHHRPKNSNINYENTVIGGVAEHHKTRSKILNKFLREDLKSNSLGFGFMINFLGSENGFRHQVNKIEAEISDIKNKVSEVHEINELTQSIDERQKILVSFQEIPIDRKLRKYIKSLPKRLRARGGHKSHNSKNT